VSIFMLLVILPSQWDAYTMSPQPQHLAVRRTITNTKQLFGKDKRVNPFFLSLSIRVRDGISNLKVNANNESNNDNSKKRRRRKQQPVTVSSDVPNVSSQKQPQMETVIRDDDYDNNVDGGSVTRQQQPDTMVEDDSYVDRTTINEIAKYKFQNVLDGNVPTSNVNIDFIENSNINSNDPIQTQVQASELVNTISSSVSNAILLPDIKEARKRKQMEEEMTRIQQEQDEQKVKIKRTDKEAFRKVSDYFLFYFLVHQCTIC
jgi:hypothetical protein